MKILNPTIHGILDYAAAVALIVAPYVLGLGDDGPIALYLSVAGGAGLILYSLLTDYTYSFAPLIPFNVHLVLDSLAGVAFVLAPFVVGFDGITRIYYIVMGVGVWAIVALTSAKA